MRGFAPRDHHKVEGRVYLGTVYQAKGMEWLKVYGM